MVANPNICTGAFQWYLPQHSHRAELLLSLYPLFGFKKLHHLFASGPFPEHHSAFHPITLFLYPMTYVFPFVLSFQSSFGFLPFFGQFYHTSFIRIAYKFSFKIYPHLTVASFTGTAKNTMYKTPKTKGAYHENSLKLYTTAYLKNTNEIKW